METKTINTLYDRESGLLFQRNSSTFFEPIKYNVKQMEDGSYTGIDIIKETLFYDFVLWVKYLSRKTNTRTGKVKEGGYEVYQYIIAFLMLRQILDEDTNNDLLLAVSRQSGKSYVVQTVIAFCLTFLPNFINNKIDRYYVGLSNNAWGSLEDQLSKTKPFIYKAVELFNLMYPENKLYTKDMDSSLIDTKRKLEIAREFKEILVPYSTLVGISLHDSVNMSGLSCHAIVVDESQSVSAEHFNDISRAFAASINGKVIAIGTTNSDVSSLLYDVYQNDKSIKIIIDVERVLKYKHLISDNHAKPYRIFIQSEKDKYGVNSEHFQSNYTINFNLANDRFLTLDKLRNNNIVTGDFCEMLPLNLPEEQYRVAGLDLASTNDYCCFISGVSTETQKDEFVNCVKNVVIFNRDKQQLSSNALCEKVISLCKTNEIDMLMIDASASQGWFYSLLVDNMVKQNCHTLVYPFSFSNHNKMAMMGYMEACLINAQLILPREEYKELHPDYKELLDELLYLKKEKSGQLITYKAPRGANYFDDAVMALGMFNYCTYYVATRTQDKEIVDFVGTKFRFKMNKYNDDKDKKQTNILKYYRI